MRDFRAIANGAVSEWYGYQDPLELEFVMRILEQRRPRVVLEIGTAYNASLACWSLAVDPELSIGIDPITLPKTVEQERSFTNLVESYNLKIIPHRSEDPLAHKELENVLGGKKVDFLFIDAEHDYDNAKRDYIEYFKYLNVPSLVGFHDIFHNKILEERGTGVWRLWEDLKKRFQYYEIYNNSSMGIGLILMDKV